MPIYDWNGSAHSEIGTIYDGNGSVNSQIGAIYDGNGSVNSLIYQAETQLTSWSSGGYCLSTPSILSISGGNITFSAMSYGAYYGAVAWTTSPYSVNTGSRVQFYMDQMHQRLVDTNVGAGVYVLGGVYVCFSASRTWYEGWTSISDALGNRGDSVLIAADGRKSHIVGAVDESWVGPATYAVACPVTGNYYIGICFSGYDGALLSNFTVSDIRLK